MCSWWVPAMARKWSTCCVRADVSSLRWLSASSGLTGPWAALSSEDDIWVAWRMRLSNKYKPDLTTYRNHESTRALEFCLTRTKLHESKIEFGRESKQPHTTVARYSFAILLGRRPWNFTLVARSRGRFAACGRSQTFKSKTTSSTYTFLRLKQLGGKPTRTKLQGLTKLLPKTKLTRTQLILNQLQAEPWRPFFGLKKCCKIHKITAFEHLHFL